MKEFDNECRGACLCDEADHARLASAARTDEGVDYVDSADQLAAAPRERRPPAATLRTEAELKRAAREAIESALREAGGRVYGPGGAAERLGLKPTTLASRIRSLGLRARR